MWFTDLYRFIFSDFFIWLGTIIFIITLTGGLKNSASKIFDFLDPYVRKKINRTP